MSDNEFDDGAWNDVDFDDPTLLTEIAKIEQNYNRLKEPVQHPPAKKPRLDPAPPERLPRAQAQPKRLVVDDDDDDEITITVDENGHYGILNDLHRATAPTPPRQSLPPPPSLVQQAPSSITSGHPSFKRPQLPHQNQATPSTVPIPTRKMQPPLPQLARFVQSNRPSPSSVVPRKRTASPPPSALELQLQQMKADLEKLQTSNSQLTTALKAAEVAKYSRDGEVSNLRRSIEQNHVKHNEEVARLMAAKADADKALMEKEKSFNKEIESVKTRYIMRQQELETSSRKHPWSSVRRQPNSSQVGLMQHTPIPKHRGTQSRSGIGGVHDTPAPVARRPRDHDAHRLAPQPDFAGFVNAFAPSSPVKSPVKARKSAKFIVPYQPQEERSSSPAPPSSQAQNLFGAWDTKDQHTPLRRQTRAPSQEGGDDAAWFSSPGDIGAEAAMDMEARPVTPENEEEDSIDLPALRIGQDEPEEIHALIISHRRDASGILSLQILLGADQSAEYARACSGLVGQGSAVGVGTALIIMAQILVKQMSSQHATLATLFDLAAALAYSFPSIIKLFLSSADPSDAALPPMLQVAEMADSILATEALSFLEAVCWRLKDDDADNISKLLRRPNFVSQAMTNDVKAAISFLAAVTSNPSTYSAVLAFPDRPSDDLTEHDIRRFPVVERLSSVINCDVDDLSEMHITALSCLAQISVSHETARTTLLDSVSLVPALINSTWNLVSRFWDTVQVPPSIAVRVLRHTIHVFHRIAFARGASNDLRDRLAGDRGGLDYLFTASIGRLAYADPPESLDEEIQEGLKKLVEFARDLLELVVDGPEMDDIYGAYQWEDPNGPRQSQEEDSSQTQDEDALMEDV
ncbi:hypothetical protein BKA62DRAFT_11612 [Auriculariales sp. MPI-PUGE-AT-0066]|nr:hypothetical protein BKA62DRAFT_11612 [Auriculariales sp. MPI-PUGE-AT-0066]